MFSFNCKLLKFVVPPSVALLLAAGCTQQPASPGMNPLTPDMPGSASIQPAMKDVSIDKLTFTPSTNTYSLARR